MCFAVGLAVHVAARFALNFRTHVTSALRIPHLRILQRSLHGVCGVISGTLGGVVPTGGVMTGLLKALGIGKGIEMGASGS